jgi:hypothetical protein
MEARLTLRIIVALLLFRLRVEVAMNWTDYTAELLLISWSSRSVSVSFPTFMQLIA